MNGNLDFISFDANTVEPSSSFDPLPVGEYNVMIVESEMKETKAKTGTYISLQMMVTDGDYMDRKVFANINVSNPNKMAEDIGRKDLSALCRAVGVMTPKDTSELHDKPFTIKLAIRPPKDGYDAQNEVKAYKPYGEASTSFSAPAAPAPAAAAKPWEKKVK